MNGRHIRLYGCHAELHVQACLQSPIVTLPAGLSLGEYCALVFAGVLSFEDGLKVVKARGESMAAAAVVGEPRPTTPLELVRAYCLSGLVVYQGLLQALGLLAHTHTVLQQIANCHSCALLCFHLGEDSGYATAGMVVSQ